MVYNNEVIRCAVDRNAITNQFAALPNREPFEDLQPKTEKP